MTFSINRVAVIGAGTMGGGIAALAASVGLPVTLLDIRPTELTADEQSKGLTLDHPAVRNRIVSSLWERQVKGKPAALFTPEAAKLVTVGNLDDDFELLRDADWIVEVIVEQLAPKQALMARIDALRKPSAIVSSNTSGIPIAQIAADRSAGFQAHFMGTHFFNPPRYMHLLEIIPTAATDPAALRFMREFAERTLGKGVVIAKDRPNFIANRIGSYVGAMRMGYAFDHGYTVEEVDAITGPLIGNPKTATFRLGDLVGIDVMAHVQGNLYDAVPEDELRELFKVPPVMAQLVSSKALGNKTGAGFYKKTKGAGGTEFHALNWQTGQYEPPTKVRFELVGQVRKIEDLGERLRAIFAHGAGDRAGDYIINTTLPILGYAARRIPEITDSIADLDSAMRWGFGTDIGPLEMWDLLGVRATAERMAQADVEVAPWVRTMLDSGIESFYQRDGNRVTGVYDPQTAQYTPIERPAGAVVLSELHGTAQELRRNDSASLLDLGDGVLGLEFHSKANSLDPQIAELGFAALELLNGDYQALVVANQGQDFCVGANLGLFIGAIQAGQYGLVEQATKQLQDLLMAFRFAPKPVVVAPFSRVLGGGTEVALAGARMAASAETYMGLVELGVGLIPAGGGCKELLRRIVSPAMQVPGTDPMPYLQKAFETIAMAKVSDSAAGARALGFLDPADRIVMNRDILVGEAKQLALDLVAQGYRPPVRAASIYAVGRKGKAALLIGIDQMQRASYISAHDAKLARTLAHVLCGGDLSAPQWVTEQYILDLERAAFIQLMQEPKTQERIAGMLQTGKPVRN